MVKKLFLLLFLSSLVAACGQNSSHAVAFPTPEIYRLKPGELILAALEDDIPPIQAEVSNFVPAEKADLDDLELIVGLLIGGKSRAYPVRLLSLHEVVNDQIDGDFFAVTWCPLCFTAIVYNRVIEDKLFSFRASGYLLNDNLVLIDHPTNTLWSQLLGQGIKGAHRGTLLEVLPSTISPWGVWKEAYPETMVLSPKTLGYVDDIYDPYTGYYSSGAAGFGSAEDTDQRLPGKSLIEGISLGNYQIAFPLEILQEQKIIQHQFESYSLVALYSELQGTSHIYLRKINGDVLNFDLNEAGDLLIDKQTGTTWDILTGIVMVPIRISSFSVCLHSWYIGLPGRVFTRRQNYITLAE